MNSSTIISQLLLEQNEDIIAAVVENLQLGRLEDCIKHYSILQSNLVAFALELDNFPTNNADAYESLLSFPDEIMRKDILEDLQPHGARKLPDPPLIPPCDACASALLPAEVCRLEFRHVEPSCKFSHMEREEFLRATQVLTSKHRQVSMDSLHGKTKRSYRIWNAHEKYSLLLGVSLFGVKDIPNLMNVMENRSENQIRSYISKHIKCAELLRTVDLLRSPPKGYQPPLPLAHLFNRAPMIDSASAPMSRVAPKQGRNDWSSLLSMAAGVMAPPTSSSVFAGAGHHVHHTASADSGVSQYPPTQTIDHVFQPPLSVHSFAPHPAFSQVQPVGSLPLPSILSAITVGALPPPPQIAPATLSDPLKEMVSASRREDELRASQTYYSLMRSKAAETVNPTQLPFTHGYPPRLPMNFSAGPPLAMDAPQQLPKRNSAPPPFARQGIARHKQLQKEKRAQQVAENEVANWQQQEQQRHAALPVDQTPLVSQSATSSGATGGRKQPRDDGREVRADEGMVQQSSAAGAPAAKKSKTKGSGSAAGSAASRRSNSISDGPASSSAGPGDEERRRYNFDIADLCRSHNNPSSSGNGATKTSSSTSSSRACNSNQRDEDGRDAEESPFILLQSGSQQAQQQCDESSMLFPNMEDGFSMFG